MNFNQPKTFEEGDRAYIATSNSDKNAGRQYYGTDNLRFVDWVTNGSTAGLEYDVKKKRYYFPPGVIPDECKKKLLRPKTTAEPKTQSVPASQTPEYIDKFQQLAQWKQPSYSVTPVDRVYNTGIPEPNEIKDQIKELVAAVNRTADELYEVRGFIESMKNTQKALLELQQEVVGMKRRRHELENIQWTQKMKKLPRVNEAQDQNEEDTPVISEEEPDDV